MNTIHPIDLLVGRKIRQGRNEAGISQGELGAALNITFQQIQKYEIGMNRVSASKLWQIGEIIEKPINWFFEIETGNVVTNKNTLRALRAFKSIENTKQAKIILDIIELMGNQDTYVAEAPENV